MAEENGGFLKYKRILFEKDGLICTITLNRAESLNAIDRQMARELEHAAERIDDDDETRAVVVTGAGDRAFSVGMDLKELVIATEGIQDLPTLSEIRQRLWDRNPCERLASLSKPTIAVIRGFALGGGLELALACDIRIASEDATFGFPEVRLGIIPSWGGTQRLPRIIGRGRAIEMIMTGEPIGALEAYRTELISRIVPAEELLVAAKELAFNLDKHAPVAIKFAREAVGKGLDMTLDQGLHLETDLSVLLQTTEDRAEGIASFLEKRPPQFTGR